MREDARRALCLRDLEVLTDADGEAVLTAQDEAVDQHRQRQLLQSEETRQGQRFSPPGLVRTPPCPIAVNGCERCVRVCVVCTHACVRECVQRVYVCLRACLCCISKTASLSPRPSCFSISNGKLNFQHTVESPLLPVWQPQLKPSLDPNHQFCTKGYSW